VSAAREVWAERGFHGASISLIAERSGLTPSGVQHHFGSKEDILLAAIEDRFEFYRAWMQSRMDSGEDFITAHVALMQQFADTPSDMTWHLALAGASIDVAHPAHDWFNQRYELIREVVTAQLVADQQSGIVRADVDAADIAVGLISLTEGIMLQWLRDPTRFDAVQAMRTWTDCLRAP
jgi:AcrR family transcriptional regulator